jgi:hypothetical protein
MDEGGGEGWLDGGEEGEDGKRGLGRNHSGSPLKKYMYLNFFILKVTPCYLFHYVCVYKYGRMAPRLPILYRGRNGSPATCEELAPTGGMVPWLPLKSWRQREEWFPVYLGRVGASRRNGSLVACEGLTPAEGMVPWLPVKSWRQREEWFPGYL